MERANVIVGAPSSIGIRPYDDGTARRLDLTPGRLRAERLVERLAARDAGDVVPGPYRDFERRPGRVRNEAEVVAYSRALAERVEAAAAEGAFVVVLGGDCSIVLGCLLGVRKAGSRIGLAYVDAHADYATPEESYTGSAASMCLALAAGRGDTVLARLAGDEALVDPADIVLIARSDQHEDEHYGDGGPGAQPLLDMPLAVVRERGPAAASRAALERLTRAGIDGFWIHVDADVLDPAIMPAVDSPEAGGLRLDELSDLLAPLVSHPRALGLELTIYDAALDPDGACAARLADLLEGVLRQEVRA
ncbi:MAG TPA: arginase family protein [Longimicrobiales bacterium]